MQHYLDNMTRSSSLWPAAIDARDAEDQLLALADPKDQVLTWSSNARHPMDDLLAAWLYLNLITEVQATATSEARQAATAEFLEEYRRVNVDRPQSAEELAEMRAAFGPGARVVNVVTGTETQL